MFEIERVDRGTLRLRGRFDAAQAPEARRVLEHIEGSHVLDCEELSYISSAGLGILVGLQLRLSKDDERVQIVNLSPHLRELFELTGLDDVLSIE